MPTGPRKIILIRSGRYEYAEVEITGALQIVGPNNTGKTTLINTLQFLYLDDRRHMDFGSYTPEQTRDFYFPNQYSYMLFECLGTDGACVIGWRGQSKTVGGDPERFSYKGPFDEADFVDEKRQVREPGDISARLALKQLRVLKSAQEHRELLLPPSGANSEGLGIVALRDSDKYHQFRETLKCLLTLSAITQEQMRDRLLMLADIPPDRTALDARSLFGEDYERIHQRRERLVRFKKNQPLVERLVDKYAERENLRGELTFRWANLREKRQSFEKNHELILVGYKAEANAQDNQLKVLAAELADRRADLQHYSEQKGALKSKLDELEAQNREFDGFSADLERAKLVNLQNEIRTLETRLASAEGESKERARQKIEDTTSLVRQAEQTIARFDSLAVTELRKHFSDPELNTLFRLLNRDLLELPMEKGGVHVERQKELLEALRQLLERTKDGVYQDANVAIHLPDHSTPLAGLDNVETAAERLKDHSQTLERWQGILAAIEQREKLLEHLNGKRTERDQTSRRLFQFEDYEKKKLEGPRWQAELRNLNNQIEAARERADVLQTQSKDAEAARETALVAMRKTEDDYNVVQARFNLCVSPDFASPSREVEIPSGFDTAINAFLTQQDKQTKLADDTSRLLIDIERCFGEEFRAPQEEETIRLLHEELEAMADKEEALTRDWNAHIHGLKATFDRILKELGEIHSAKDNLNRHFARVQVSNLKTLRMEVLEQGDLVSWIKRLAVFEPGGLFDQDTQQESAVTNFRAKLQDNPIVRFADLFTLGVTVEGPDGRKHTYHDFRQIESHGTTVAIKVLFNLLLLKSQLKRDDCQVPFFLDEIQILDPTNRNAILATARKLGFLAITAAPEAVSEVDSLYFLQPRKGWIVLRNQHRIGVKAATTA